MSRGKRKNYIRVIVLITYLFIIGITGVLCAQDTIPETIYTDTIISTGDFVIISNEVIDLTNTDTFVIGQDSVILPPDSILYLSDDSVFINFSDPSVIIASEKNKSVTVRDATEFKPNPKIAWKVAIIFPGFGQIYNRQYWKLPIVYGGLMGCVYAITWNNKTYQDYKTAFFDITNDFKNDPKAENPDSWSESWKNYVRGDNYAAQLQNRNFHDNLKRGKDYFRRYRDLSFIICVGLYMIFVADTYVDAQMFDFDVSPDLSFQVTPVFTPENITGSRSFGINICMTF